MRPITLFTGQWADLELSEVAGIAAKLGYDGLELATWGKHLDVERALSEPRYLDSVKRCLEENGLAVFAVSGHLTGHAVTDDPIDQRHQRILPERLWGEGDIDGVHRRAAHEMVRLGEVAQKLGAKTVTGFTGSPTWKFQAMFPPVTEAEVEEGYQTVARAWRPILQAYAEQDVRFALEVHPTQIAYDYWSASRILDILGTEENFGFNWDPSHLTWQGVDPASFLRDFGDRIFHVHCKDSRRNIGNGRNGILSSHLPWGDHRRGWDVVSLGKGDTDWDACLRALNDIHYTGPLSVEWEDPGMDRIQGITQSLAFLRGAVFDPPSLSFADALHPDTTARAQGGRRWADSSPPFQFRSLWTG